MATFSLGKHPHVELCDLLKLEGWSESGAQAKIAIAEGLVKVDGAVETRKRSTSRQLNVRPHVNRRRSDSEFCRSQRTGCCLIPFPACINRPVLFSDFCPLRPVHPC
ncbi:hypothetical protein EIMP300_72640 [Escherichia coli]|uniref:Ribosome-associated protein n=1 Tax=Escherichia coli TaxID=562 RepID=A0A8S0FZF7_ECOLX|nr:hypothetical protein EIMP300_72640 [Escherichia coli]